MNGIVQAAQVTNKWKLAEYFSNNAKSPEEALKHLFDGVIEGLEYRAGAQFETSIKDRVWKAVSREELKTLRETFILKFYEEILDSCDEDEAKVMLEEYKRTGSLSSLQLQTAFILRESSIIYSVVQKANSMAEEWIPKITEALKKEGIEFPEEKKTKNNSSRGVCQIL